MGIDIAGWIEIKDHLDDKWIGAVKIGGELIHDDRNYPMQAFLFGIHNPQYENVLASHRGLPHDISEDARKSAVVPSWHSYSWITWDELENLEWKESQRGYGIDMRTEKHLTTNEEVVMSGGWYLIFDLMRTLAEYHKANHVRLVVWFG
jgi:hypothetical protein